MKPPFISIGESIHASTTKTGKVMARLHQRGPDAYTAPSEALDYIRGLIERQARENAAYIAVNLDEFGVGEPQKSLAMMIEYVRLIRRWGNGVPVCIDSGSDEVLIAGLKEWYDTDLPVKPPLVNAVKIYTADRLMPLKKEYDFSFIALLIGDDKPTGPGDYRPVEELYGDAVKLFEKAMAYGFTPGEIFFDTTAFPIAIDIPKEPDTPGYTYRAFETIKKIKNDPALKGCHFSLGISNCCHNLPGRKIGIRRAFLARAIEYGLDAGIVNVSHRFGETPADPELLQLIDAYAQLNGSRENRDRAKLLMNRFCESCKKPG